MSNTMAIGSYGYDPYFMQAYNYPNYNAQIRNTQTQASQTNTQTQANTPVTTNNATQAGVTFKGTDKKEKKDHTAAWAILGTVAVVGAGLLCRKAYKAGVGEGTFAKIKDGFSKMLSSAKNSVSGLVSSGKADDVFTIAKNGDDIICTIPGKTNVLKGANLADDVARLGSNVDMPALTDKATEILKYETKLSDDSTVITVMGDKLRSIVDSSGNKISVDKLSDLGKSEVNRLITAVKNKDEAILANLQNVVARQTDNGVTRKFVAQATDAAKNGVRSASTNKFLVDSTAVKAYRQQNPQLSEAIEEFGKDVVSKFKINTAEKATDIGTFKIVGDKIAGIQTAGGYYPVDSQNYRALLFDNKEIFDSVLSDPKKFTNIVYRAA